MYTHTRDVHSFTSMSTHVYPCTPTYTHIYTYIHSCILPLKPCTPMYTNVYQCTPMHIHEHSCTPMYTHVHTYVHSCILPLKPVYELLHAKNVILHSYTLIYMYTMYTSVQYHEFGTLVLYHATYDGQWPTNSVLPLYISHFALGQNPERNCKQFFNLYIVYVTQPSRSCVTNLQQFGGY